MIRTGLIASTIALSIMAGVMIWTFQAMPYGTDIPLHWGINGEVDRYGSRNEALFAIGIIPAAALLTTLLMTVAPSLDPRKANLQKSALLYKLTWVAVMILLTGVHFGMATMMVQGTTQPDINTIPFVRFVIAGGAILYVILGNYLPKTRPNWFLGIRTPWTLSSDNTWEKTHRLGGRLFFIIGLVGIVGAFLLNGLWLGVVLPMLALPVALICVIYSYLVWRKSDDKHLGADLIV